MTTPTKDIRTFFHPKTETETCPVPHWVEVIIRIVLKNGNFHDVKFKKGQRKRFIREVAEEFMPTIDEFDPEYRDEEACEVMRELIKDWMGDNYTSWM
jgi:hypothetical protein